MKMSLTTTIACLLATGVPWAMLGVLAGCAASAPAPSAPGAPPRAVVADQRYGVIVIERPVRPIAAASDDVRGTIMAALGEAGATEAGPQPPVTEFIVRADDGRLVSIVQANTSRLHRGDRVAIAAVPHAALQRVEPGS